MSGALVSFDGLDSSGKATQVALFVDRLRQAGKQVLKLETPDYNTPSGQELRSRLQGKLGNWNETPWEEKLGYFATNRLEHRQEVLDTLAGGGIVVYDRYVPSSLVFMEVEAGSEVERAEVHAKVEAVEYNQNEMPREDVSIFLDVPPQVAAELLSGRKRDQQEEDEYTDQLEVQQQMYEAYVRLALEQPDRVLRIDCMDGKNLRSPANISTLVWNTVSDRIRM